MVLKYRDYENKKNTVGKTLLSFNIKSKVFGNIMFPWLKLAQKNAVKLVWVPEYRRIFGNDNW